MPDDFLHVKNLEKYHPGYKDRNLIWCKTYFTMINADPEFEMLTEVDKWRFICFIMLELQIKRPIPLDSEYLVKKGFDLKNRPIELTLKMLHNFTERVTQDLKLCVVDIEKRREDIEQKKVVTVTTKNHDKPLNQDEAEVYFQEHDSDKSEGAKFWSFYESKGWMVGKNPMKNWHMAASGWILRNIPKDEPEKNYKPQVL